MERTNYDVKTLYKVATVFVGSPDATFEDVATQFKWESGKTVSDILYRGIARCIYPEILAGLVFKKIRKINRKSNYPRWERAFEERDRNRSILSARIQQAKVEKSKYDLVIEHYDVYVAKSDSPLPLEELIKRRTELEQFIKVTILLIV